MRVTIGSTNPVKLEAVEELIRDYEIFEGSTVKSVAVPIDEFGYPKSLEETIEGAIKRAKDAYIDCVYSFGIKSGLMKVPCAKIGLMDVCACVIYDGTECHFGLSSAFEYPKKMTELIIKNGLDASQACRVAGLINHSKLGGCEDVISLLTKGKLNRKNYTKEAIRMAIIHLENPEHYN